MTSFFPRTYPSADVIETNRSLTILKKIEDYQCKKLISFSFLVLVYLSYFLRGHKIQSYHEKLSAGTNRSMIPA